MNEHDLKTVRAMRNYGGRFVKCLAEAAMAADADNLQRIKSAFPEYWTRYEQMAKADAQEPQS